MITDGLVLYLPFYHPELQGSPIISRDIYEHSCAVTGALWTPLGRNFDGADDIINCGSASILDNLAAMTIILWVKPDTLGESSVGRLIGKTPGDIPGWFLRFNTSNRLSANIDYDGSDLYRFSATNVVTMSVWQMVTATWDGSTTATNFKMYVNNAEVSYGAGQNAIGSRVDDEAAILYVGSNATTTKSYDGLIGEVLLYNKVLSLAQIQQIYSELLLKYITRWDYFTWA